MSVSELLVPNTFNLYCESINNASGPITGISAIEVPNDLNLYCGSISNTAGLITGISAIEVPNSLVLYGSTPASNDNSTKLSTTAYVTTAIADIPPSTTYPLSTPLADTLGTLGLTNGNVTFASPSLSIGTWLVSWSAHCVSLGTPLTPSFCNISISLSGTATATQLGGTNTSYITAQVSADANQSLFCLVILHVTVAGTIILQGYTSDTNIDTSSAEQLYDAGYTCTRVA